MAKRAGEKLVLAFTIVYLAVFALIAFIRKNYEFLYYTSIMSLLLILVVLYYKKVHLTSIILWSLSILGLMNVAGGNAYFHGTRLYDLWLIGGILKYDNVVHALSIFAATFVAYNIISPHLDLKTNHHPALFSLLLILIALGIGAINEIMEFATVVFLGAQETVGDYFNNALDLVFNLFGSVIACLFIFPYHRKRQAGK